MTAIRNRTEPELRADDAPSFHDYLLHSSKANDTRPLRESRRKLLGIFVYEMLLCEKKMYTEAEIVSRSVFSLVPVVARKTLQFMPLVR